MLQSQTTKTSLKTSVKRKSKSKQNQESDFCIEQWSDNEVKDLIVELDIAAPREYLDYTSDCNSWYR